MKKTVLIIMLVGVFAILMTGCGGSSSTGNSGEIKKITIGSKSFSESALLSSITAHYLEANGFEVTETGNMSSTILRQAMLNNEVDLSWDYTGTGLIAYLGQEPLTDPQETFETVKKLDAEENNIVWMNMSAINNTFALAMTRSKATELGIISISDLAEYVNQHPGELTFSSTEEFSSREDGLPGLQKTYNFEFGEKNAINIRTGLQYDAIIHDEIQVTEVFATNPQIKEFDLVVLEDDKQFFPAYHATVLVRQEVFEKYPELEQLTADIAQMLGQEMMQELNYIVDIEGRPVEVVAKNWMEESGMLK